MENFPNIMYAISCIMIFVYSLVYSNKYLAIANLVFITIDILTNYIKKEFIFISKLYIIIPLIKIITISYLILM